MWFPADVVRNFNPEIPRLHRAFDHLIGARIGMTLMVPVVASIGKFHNLVDQCPVPHSEAAAILEADYRCAQALDLPALVFSPGWKRINNFQPLAQIGRDFAELFLGEGGIYKYDHDWRHTQISLAQGGQPCRVLIGRSGARLAFTPDFFEGVL